MKRRSLQGHDAITKKTGITREGLYKAPSTEGDLKLSTFVGVLKSLNLRLSVKPLEESAGMDRADGVSDAV
ncbi:MAG: hypothetical protein NTV73_14135 [Hyphomicrobiales bacterium]|nr:hypothetical protein [Hyphomicrobiales bacterium]